MTVSRTKARGLGRTRRLFVACAAAVLLVAAAGPAQAATVKEFPTATFSTFPIPAAGAGIAAGPDGALWFAELSANKIGRITTDGKTTEYSIPTAGSMPLSVTRGPDGAVWFTEKAAGKIGRIAADGTITEYPVPALAPDQPPEPNEITQGPDGALWFTGRGRATNPRGFVGRIATGGAITLFEIQSGRNPHGIVAGPDGALWFAEPDADKIGRITTDGAITDYPTIGFNVSPRWITAGPDGALWYTQSGAVMRMTTNGTVTVALRGGSGGVITKGRDGALWFPQSGMVNRLTTSGKLTSYGFSEPGRETGGFAPQWITPGPDGALWFTELAGSRIGRLAPHAAGATASAVNAALKQVGRPASGTTIESLLAKRSVKLPFSAPSGGKLAIAWYQGKVPAGAARTVVVATGKLSRDDAGKAKVVVKLTKTGRRALKGAKASLQLASKASFTPTGGATTTAKPVKFTLKHKR